MLAVRPPANLLSVSAPSAPNRKARRQAARRAATVGAYGGIALAAWLTGAVAAGHGVAAADDSTGSSSSASSRDGSNAGPRSTGHANTRASRVAKPAAASSTPAASSSTTKRSRGALTTSSNAVSAPAPTVSAVTNTGTSTASTQTARSTARAVAAIHPSAAASVPAALTANATTFRPLQGLNALVVKLTNPFLKPPPKTPGPIVPLIWSVMGAVREDLFNQAPTIAFDGSASTQTGQTVSGNLGGIDPEGDALTYTVTQAPKYGKLTIDQATGNFTYTPDQINYTDAQVDSWTVSVTDGKFNILMPLSSRTSSADEGATVLSPQATRVILNVSSQVSSPDGARFAPDGTTLLFAGTPVAGGRSEIWSMSASDTDGSTVQCITCGVSTSITNNLRKPVPTDDGSGRILMQSVPVAGGRYTHVVYQPAVGQPGDPDYVAASLIPVITPAGGSTAIDPQREMRISPDGQYVLFSQIVLGAGNNITAIPIVGKLDLSTNATTGAPEYHVDDARVVYPVGEGKQWTPDGKGVIILGGQYEGGNVDDIVVDVATGQVTRMTGNLDYDEDTDMSPNLQWIAIGSTRGFDALTPMSRIVRPALLPAYVQGSVYNAWAGNLKTVTYPNGTGINVSNQEWLVAIQDDLNRVNGIPLFVNGDGYTARSMPSFNADGTSVAFWERSITDPTDTRLVIANLKYTTSVGTVQGGLTTSNPDWAPKLATYKAGPAPLPPVGAYLGAGGGTAYVTEAPDPVINGNTLRTVTYTNYVNDEGMILNGTESTSTNATQASIVYKANIGVTGSHTGSLTADATINKLTTTITGTISSTLDGDTQVLLDPAVVIGAQLGA